MISYIKGLLAAVYEEGIVIDNHGIGYNIKTPAIVLDKLPPVGSEVKIHTYMHVREDALSLFGFLSREELSTFQILIGVNGIGPKAGLAILSTLTVDELRFAVFSDDVKTISKTPGIGPKGASRLIMELKDKLKIEDALDSFGADQTNEVQSFDGVDVRKETTMALISLGYSNSDALRAVKSVDGADQMGTEDLLKAALKKIITL